MKEKYQVLIGGDFMPGTDGRCYDPFSSNVKKLFREADYTLVNLEAPLTDRGRPILKTGINFRINPKYAEILKNAGIDCVTLANNHIRDFGDEGVLDTLRHCSEAGLDVLGAGKDIDDAARPIIKNLGNIKIAFLNYCEKEFSIANDHQAGANPFDLIDTCNDIKKLENQVDKIVIVYHGGLEYHHYPTCEMRKILRFLIEFGADAIIAHHAHYYSGKEVLYGKPVCYGLGNLFFPITQKTNDEWWTGLVADLSINKDTFECAMHPTKVNFKKNEVDLLSSNLQDDILRHVEQLSSCIEKGEIDKYWNEVYTSIKHDVITGYSVKSRLFLRIRKRLGLKITRLSNYRGNIWLNTMRCSSHREKMIEILERIYQENEV